MKLYGNNGLASFKYAKGNYKEVHVRTLKDVCEENIDTEIHFLKIDAEGWEKNVLEGMDFEHYRPWIVRIEATKPMSTVPVFDQWENILTGNHYVFVGMYNVNRYYVAHEREKDVRQFPTDEVLNNNYDVVFYNENRKFERYRKIDKFMQPFKLALKRLFKR